MIEVGDTVRILDGRQINSHVFWNPAMDKLVGAVATVADKFDNRYGTRYLLSGFDKSEDNYWVYDVNWLERVSPTLEVDNAELDDMFSEFC